MILADDEHEETMKYDFVESGRREERAAIVAYLRSVTGLAEGLWDVKTRMVVRQLAELIEAGEAESFRCRR